MGGGGGGVGVAPGGDRGIDGGASWTACSIAKDKEEVRCNESAYEMHATIVYSVCMEKEKELLWLQNLCKKYNKLISQ